MRLVHSAVAVAIGIALLPMAHAQRVKPTATQEQVARKYVVAGLAAQKASDFDTAITLYRKAYELVPHPVLLFNMAQAHRLAQHDREAIELYRRFIREAPDRPETITAQKHLADLEARKAVEARAAAASEAELARRVEDVRGLELEDDAAEERQRGSTSSVVQTRRRDGSRDDGRTLRWSGAAATGLGVVSLGASVGFGLRARSLSNDLSQDSAAFDPAKASSGKHAERISIVTAIAGGVLVVGGVLSYRLGYKQNQRSRNRISPGAYVSHDAIGLVFNGRLP